MARPGYSDIPPDAAAPDGAVEMLEVFLDANGAATTGPVSGGQVKIMFYGGDGALLRTTHGRFD